MEVSIYSLEGTIVTGIVYPGTSSTISDILNAINPIHFAVRFLKYFSGGWSAMISYKDSILVKDFYRQVILTGTLFFVVFLSFGFFTGYPVLLFVRKFWPQVCVYLRWKDCLS